MLIRQKYYVFTVKYHLTNLHNILLQQLISKENINQLFKKLKNNFIFLSLFYLDYVVFTLQS
jgi:hypothetical protein